MSDGSTNADERVVADFGAEWARFNQANLDDAEREAIFQKYFAVFPWDRLPNGAVGVDVGCGSGRWALSVAPRVGRLHCVDASDEALDIARRTLRSQPNVEVHHTSVASLPFPDSSLDFAYSLGVLHHVPDPAAGIRAIARVLKPGAPFLLYVYYAFDNRPAWFKILWRATDITRQAISRLPRRLKNVACDIIAVTAYWPAARLGGLLNRFRAVPSAWPLAFYSTKSFYTMRTDSLDRFGTRLEHRFTQSQIQSMMFEAGFINVHFSDQMPYWCAVGFKK